MCLQIKVIWVREELPVLEVYVGYGGLGNQRPE